MGRLSDLYNDLSQQQSEAESRYIRTTTPGLRMPSPEPEPAQEEEDSGPGLLSDAWSSFGMGSGQLVKGAGWLFGSEGMEKLGQETTEYWERQLSDAQREANQERFVEDDFSLGEGATNPRTWMGTIVQSLPMMTPGIGAAGLAGRGAMALGAGRGAATAAAATAGSTMEGATIGAMVGEEVESAIMQAPIEELQNSPYFQDLIEAGKSETEARAMVAEKASEGAGAKAGVVGAILGVGFNKFVGDAVTGRLSERLLKETGKGALEGAVTELAQTGVESYAKQSALQDNLGRPISLSEMANEMVAGTGAGGLMGGAVGAAGSFSGSSENPQTETPEQGADRQGGQDQQQSDPGPTMEPGSQSETQQGQPAAPQEPAFDDPLDNIGQRYEQAQNQPPSISRMGRNLAEVPRAPDPEPEARAAPLSEQVGTEQDQSIVYDQDGVRVTRFGDNRFEATLEGSDIAAQGRDISEARRRLQQIVERNKPKAPVLQNRDRSDPGYIQQMNDIANNPDYDQVSVSKTPDAGAPMVFAQGQVDLVPETDVGRPETITMADGRGGTRKIRAQYAVVEADQLKASHRADGTQNQDYGRDGLIALNNGRTAGLQEAYSRGRADAYRRAMMDDAQALGIDPAAIQAKSKPVLVRLFDGAQLEGIADPGAASNERLSADLSPSEQAQTDARRITGDVLAALNPGSPTGSGNVEFVRAALAAIAGDSRKTDLRDRDGLLTAAGKKRIEGALVERAYSDQNLTRELVEATDSDLKTLGDALIEVAGRWALMRERANEGSINPDMDINDALVGAVNMIRKSRQEGRSLKDLASQVDAFAGEADQMAVQILHLFYHGANYGRIRAKDTIVNALQGYISTALETSPGPDMFGEMARPQDALENQRGQIEGETPQAPTPRVPTDGRDNRETGQEGEGPGSNSVRQADAAQGGQQSGEQRVTEGGETIPPEYDDLFDESGRRRFPSSAKVQAFKRENDIGLDGVRAIQKSILDGKPISLDAAREIDQAAKGRREQDRNDEFSEEARAKSDASAEERAQKEQKERDDYVAEAGAIEPGFYRDKDTGFTFEVLATGLVLSVNPDGTTTPFGTMKKGQADTDGVAFASFFKRGIVEKVGGQTSAQQADATPPLDLEAQTEEQLAERARKNQEAADTEARQKREAEQREKADAEAGDFTLSGSNSPIDQAEARGQGNMFDAPAEAEPAARQDAVESESATPAEQVEQAAAEVDQNPTEPQIEAGNYKKGHVTVQGLDITLENPRGSIRSGTDPDGNEWSVTMAHHYGYLKRTKGADGEHVDVFVGQDLDSDAVFIVDQVNPDGSFDEHKVLLGFKNQVQARKGYKDNYTKDWKVGPITRMTMDEFKTWLADGDLTKPLKLEEGAEARQQTQKRSRRSTAELRRKEAVEAWLGDATTGDRITLTGDAGYAKGGREYTVGQIDGSGVEVSSDNGKTVISHSEIAGAKRNGVSVRKVEADQAESKPAEPVQPAAPIEDFGEKIEGARKDYASKMAAAKEKDVAAVPLSESWPEPDYQKLLDSGANSDAVAFAHAARDEVPPKPRKGWKLSGWARQVEALRNFTESVIDGDIDVADVREHARKDQFKAVDRNVFNRADLYAAVGHAKSLKGLRFANVHYTMYEGKTGSFDKWQIERIAKTNDFGNMPRRLVSADTKEQAIAQFRKLHESLGAKGAEPKSTRFDIYTSRHDRNDVFIGKKIGKDVVRIKEGFSSVKEAREYLSTQKDALERILAKMKHIPNHRKESNAPRVGKDHRNGGDVTPEAFSETFGFRGVQFGNYVEQGRRQQDLNEAYDGLMDLAGILNIPAKAISLNGELGLAFGARGKGGKTAPKAHYEPNQIVINLTKKDGAGSLAHEWFHALDNYFARERGGKSADRFATRGEPDKATRPEVIDAFRNIRQTVSRIRLRERSRKLDRMRTKAYWSTDVEMTARAFESYVIEKLKDQGGSNEYLANIVSEDYWKASEALGLQDGDSYPYPEAAEIPEIRAAYDNLFEVIETREDDAGNVAMFMRKRGATTKGLSEARVQATVDRFLRDYPGAANVGIKIHSSAADLPGFDPARDSGSTIAGQYVSTTDTVHLVRTAFDSESQVREALQEEILVHKGLGFFRPEDRQQLYRDIQQAAQENEGLADLWSKTVADYEPVVRSHKLNEEQANRLYAEEMLGTLAQTKVNWMHRGWRRLKMAIKNLLVKAGWIRSGISESDLRSRIDLVARAFQRGKRAPLRNFSEDIVRGEGQSDVAPFARASQLNTEAFQNWFGDSKVVDENGEPLVVYHGTDEQFDVFDPAKAGMGNDRGMRGRGLYFSPNERTAASYGKNVMPVYVSIQNPFTPSDFASKEAIAQRLGIDESIFEYGPDSGFKVYQPYSGTFTSALKEAGYDGVIYPDRQEVIAFLPEQIKSATGNNGDFDPNNLDIMFSRTGNRLDAAASHFDDLTDDQRSALGKIAPRTPKERAQDWIKERTDRWQTKLRQGIVDRFAALKDIDEAVHGKDVVEGSTASSSWVLAQMSGAASGALQTMLTAGRIQLNRQQKVIDLQPGDQRGLNDLLKDLGTAAEIERFFGWIAGNRSRRLMAEGRENLFEPQEVEALAQLNRGVTDSGQSRLALYDKVFREFQQYRDDVLSIAEDTGIITAEQRETWANEFYVPFYRLADNDGTFTGPKSSGGITRQEAYKKLKGGSQNLNDLLENTMMNFYHLLQASLKNQAAMQAMDNAQELGIARVVRESDRDTENSTFVLRDGQKTWYEIDDPMVFKAVTALAHPGMNSSAMKVMRGFKRIFTNFTTTTPQFVIANLLRDSMQASATSEVSKNFLKNMVQGGKAYGDPRIRARMMASGGSFSFGHLYGENADELRLQITGGLARADILRQPSMIPGAVAGLWRKWNEMTEFTENMNRAAIFEQNQDRGELYAAFKSRDLMNFSQYGAWPAMRVLIDVVPFLNARLQGLDKIYRSGVKPGLRTVMGSASASEKQAAARFWSVTGAITLASIALYLSNRDDEEYQKLEEWQKDTYWFLRLSDDHAIFIPKPFEVGAMATLAERLTEQAVSDTATGELFAQRLGHMLMDTFSFSPIPQMFQPALDVYANYDAFTGRPIESMGMDRLSPNLRRRASTTALAVGASRVTGAVSGIWGGEGLSPVQADHLIQGYLGAVGSWAAGLTDTVWKTANGETSPSNFWYENQPVRRFYSNLSDEPRYTRYGTVFYESLREANRVYADIMEYAKLGEVEAARKLAADNRQVLAYRVMLNRLQSKLSDISKAMQQVQRMEGSPEYKRREMDRLRALRNRIHIAIGKKLESQGGL